MIRPASVLPAPAYAGVIMAQQGSGDSAMGVPPAENRFIRILRYFLGPADSSPMGDPVDTSGYGQRLCPQCGFPFDDHRIERTDQTSRIYCPVS